VPIRWSTKQNEYSHSTECNRHPYAHRSTSTCEHSLHKPHSKLWRGLMIQQTYQSVYTLIDTHTWHWMAPSTTIHNSYKHNTCILHVRGSVYHSTIHEEKSNKIQKCIKTLFPIYMKLNMFRATHRPSSGAWNCTGSFWLFICRRLLDVWSVDSVRHIVPDNMPDTLLHLVGFFFHEQHLYIFKTQY
jgi:hypothetical protein